MVERVSAKMLEQLEGSLGERDRAILRAIRDHRYLTTDQVHRLYFHESATPSAGLRAASRNLKKLKELHLIGSLSRRIGGVYAGSGSYIWRLEAAGDHLLRRMSSTPHPRRKRFEPSTYFLAHTLATAECTVRIVEICRRDGMKLMELQQEPINWRPYNSGGKMVTLKPDLFAVTVCEAYEDRWFIEMDLATVSVAKILEKCRRYHRYYQTGFEQKQCGVFPLVAWIVPDEARRATLIRHMQQEFAKLPRIFTVILPEELESLIRQGAGDTAEEVTG